MKLIDSIKFWLWHKEIANKMKHHSALPFIWKMRVEFVYKPLFREKGLQAVLDEHEKHMIDIIEETV